MNISHVDFKAGMNTRTYKYYIDFAADNKIPYIIIDAGWSEELDLTKTSPQINLQEVLDYGKQKKCRCNSLGHMVCCYTTNG